MLVWENTENSPGPRKDRRDWSDEATVLFESPGRWGRISEAEKNYSLGNNVTRGMIAAFRNITQGNGGEFQQRSRKGPRGIEVWIRYIPEGYEGE